MTRRLELLGHLRSHTTVLLTPAIVRLLSDLKRLTDVRDLLPFAKGNIRLTKLLDNPWSRVTCLLHLKRILSGLRPDAILSKDWISYRGEAHDHMAEFVESHHRVPAQRHSETAKRS